MRDGIFDKINALLARLLTYVDVLAVLYLDSLLSRPGLRAVSKHFSKFESLEPWNKKKFTTFKCIEGPF